MRSRRGWNAGLLRGVVLVGSAVVVLGSVWLLRTGNLERNSQIAGVAGTFIGLAGLVLAVLQRRQPAPPLGDDASWRDRALDGLATAVRAQWEAEAGLRELFRPAPVRLTWKATDRPVAAPGAP